MDKDKAITFMHDLLRNMLQKGGSDLFITAGAPPSMKVDGKLTPVTDQPLTGSHAQLLVRSIMNDHQIRQYEKTQECNFAIGLPNVSRFRVNAFMQRNSPGMVLRVINSKIPTIEELHLPRVIKDIAMTKLGLVIFVGGTGCGKSTSLASMLGYRNEHSYGHIVTIEDPIEFLHKHHNCIVTQREVGVDTESFEVALKNTLRQAPDVILIGEIRDSETMEYAVAFAETGHLCLATLHANSTNQALDRIVNFFPEERRPQLLMDLSLNLKAVVSQRLLTLKDADGRVPAVEILINSPLMADLILKGDVPKIKALIAKSRELGMQTFDQHLFDLIETNMISIEDGLRHADSVNDLRLRLKLESKHSKDNNLLDGLEALKMEEDTQEFGIGSLK